MVLLDLLLALAALGTFYFAGMWRQKQIRLLKKNLSEVATLRAESIDAWAESQQRCQELREERDKIGNNLILEHNEKVRLQNVLDQIQRLLDG